MATATYRVRQGDSLYRISARTKTPVRVLLALNHLTLRSVIHPGMILKVNAPVRPSRPVVGNIVHPPQMPSTRRVAVIGDSLTVACAPALGASLTKAGLVHVIDAASSRRIPGDGSEPLSGVKAVHRVRTMRGEFSEWVIALGSNDLSAVAQLPNGYGRTAADVVDHYVDAIRGAITPGAKLWWVNVNNPQFGTADQTFNRLLPRPGLTVIDWYRVSAAQRLAWFVDHVHVNRLGVMARAALIARALTRH